MADLADRLPKQAEAVVAFAASFSKADKDRESASTARQRLTLAGYQNAARSISSLPARRLSRSSCVLTVATGLYLLSPFVHYFESRTGLSAS